MIVEGCTCKCSEINAARSDQANDEIRDGSLYEKKYSGGYMGADTTV